MFYTYICLPKVKILRPLQCNGCAWSLDNNLKMMLVKPHDVAHEKRVFTKIMINIFKMKEIYFFLTFVSLLLASKIDAEVLFVP